MSASIMICPKCGADRTKEKCNYDGGDCVMVGAAPAAALATPPASAQAASAQAVAEYVMPEVKRWQEIIGVPLTTKPTAPTKLAMVAEIEGLRRIYSEYAKAMEGAVTYIKRLEGKLAAQAVAPAQVEHEPIGYASVHELRKLQDPGNSRMVAICSAPIQPDVTVPLYTRPQAAQPAAQVAGLTDDGILQMFAQAVGNENEGARYVEVFPEEAIEFARAILAAKYAPADGGGV